MAIAAQKPANVPAGVARRMLLSAQGLLTDPARPATARNLQSLIEQMGFVQIDTINTVERAHHLTLLSRMGEYRPALLAKLLEHKRSLFEHWTHDASVIPSKWFPHWKHRFERHRQRIRTNAWWNQRIGANPDAMIEQIKQRIERDGPLLSRDFEHDRNESGSGSAPIENGWWGWKPQKAALEYLWRTGELAVARRINFQKVYDLTERVLHEHWSQPAPELEEHIDWACRSALERLGVATPAELAGFWNAITLQQARSWCAATVEAKRGEVVQVLVESADGSKPRAAFAFHDWHKAAARLSSPPDRMRLLSPFDPVLRDRKRTLRLFNFDYTFEAFVPAPKRKYGYYVLPILEGERLVGRLDPKLHRDRGGGVLEIKRIWWEPGVKPTKKRKGALREAVERMACGIGAQCIDFAVTD
jgi:uncharacterized protein YcaQ